MSTRALDQQPRNSHVASRSDTMSKTALPDVPGFDLVGQTQTFYGYCESCRSDTASNVQGETAWRNR